MNNATYWKTIETVARRTKIRLLNDIGTARWLAKKPHCVNFRVFDGQVTLPDAQVEATVAEKQQSQEGVVGIEMQMIN